MKRILLLNRIDNLQFDQKANRYIADLTLDGLPTQKYYLTIKQAENLDMDLGGNEGSTADRMVWCVINKADDGVLSFVDCGVNEQALKRLQILYLI